MKKILFSLILVLLTTVSFSQVVAIGNEKRFDYGGILTKKVYNILNENEKELVKKCFKEVNMMESDTVWVKDKLMNEIHDNHLSFNRIILNVNTLKPNVIREDKVGTINRNMSPKCLIFISREYDVSYVKLQIYY